MMVFWVKDIAGGPRPCSATDVQRLKNAHGISAILSLTEIPLPEQWCEGFDMCHVPVHDFSPPTEEDFLRCCAFLKKTLDAGKVPFVHCTMGIGRTGTVLAGWLVMQGYTAEDALKEVRKEQPGAVETEEQVRFLHHVQRAYRATHKKAQ